MTKLCSRPRGWCLPALLFLALCAADAAPGTDLKRPNVLWIIMDDTGAEFPAYGEKAIRTPEADRLAREGTRFDRAFLTASVCSPSRSAMITGMYQTSIGAHHHRSGRGEKKILLPQGVEPVPVLFQRAGYYTCNGNWGSRARGLGKTDYNFEWDRSMYDGPDWSGRKPGQPFFAQIQLWGGKNRNDNGRWHREVAPKALGSVTPPDKVSLPPYYPRDRVLLEDWAQYLDCVRYSDLELGQIRSRLEKEGILDETIVIFMGDNGISHARGKQFLYDEGIRTPFIVRGPGIKPGVVRTDLVEHIDMAAMSLAWAGIAVPAYMQGRNVFDPAYRKREAVFAARDRCDETIDRIRSVRTERYKYIRNYYPKRPLLQPNAYKDAKPILQRLRDLNAAGNLNELTQRLLFAPARPAEELYDLRADTFETRNLTEVAEHRQTLMEMRLRLDAWIKETGDRGPESPEMYESDMAVYLNEIKAPERRRVIEKNIELTRQWSRALPGP